MKKVLVASLTGLLVAQAASAALLTFEGMGSNGAIPDNWGSNIAADGTGFGISNGATPNIGLTWTAEAGTSGLQAWEFYNDGEWSVAQLNATEEQTSFYLTLTPDSGYGVLLDSFVFDDYAGWEGGSAFAWNLYEDVAGGTTIASGSETTTDGQDLLVNTGMTSSYAGTVVFEIHNTLSGGSTNSGSDHGLDNISFTQVAVPEPATLGLLSLAFGGLLMMRRRRM